MTLRIKLGLLGRALLTFEKYYFRHPASPISMVSLGYIFDFAKLHLLIQLQVEGINFSPDLVCPYLLLCLCNLCFKLTNYCRCNTANYIHRDSFAIDNLNCNFTLDYTIDKQLSSLISDCVCSNL